MDFFYTPINENSDKKKRHLNKITVILTLTLIMSFIYYALMQNQKNYNNKSRKEFDKYIDALYFSVINATTVGFGDITPQSNLTKIVSILHNVLNFVIMAL